VPLKIWAGKIQFVFVERSSTIERYVNPPLKIGSYCHLWASQFLSYLHFASPIQFITLLQINKQIYKFTILQCTILQFSSFAQPKSKGLLLLRLDFRFFRFLWYGSFRKPASKPVSQFPGGLRALLILSHLII
jgi:hypothetical protein